MGVMAIFSRKRSGSTLSIVLGTAANANALGIDRPRAAETVRATQDELELRVKRRTKELEMQVIERQKAEEHLRELTTEFFSCKMTNAGELLANCMTEQGNISPRFK